jgi:3-dehydroquinate synthase
VARLERVIKKAGLPVVVPDLDKKALVQAMQHDKKLRQDKVRFVLLKSIGEAFISDGVDPAVVEEVLRGGG